MVLSAEARPRPKQQRLDRAACQAQSRGDLGVAQSADFAQREGGAMRRSQAVERRADQPLIFSGEPHGFGRAPARRVGIRIGHDIA